MSGAAAAVVVREQQAATPADAALVALSNALLSIQRMLAPVRVRELTALGHDQLVRAREVAARVDELAVLVVIDHAEAIAEARSRLT